MSIVIGICGLFLVLLALVASKLMGDEPDSSQTSLGLHGAASDKSDGSHVYSALVAEALNGQAASQETCEAADREFEQAVSRTISLDRWEQHFYTKVAGCSHRNNDGSFRTRIIDECDVFELLDLNAEPENKFDPNAIAVCRHGAQRQLGYLAARTAAQVTADRVKRDGQWVAMFRHKDRHPESGRTVGAVIFLIRLVDDEAKS